MILTEKMKTITTNFEPTNDLDGINKAYPDENLLKKTSYINIRQKLQRI